MTGYLQEAEWCHTKHKPSFVDQVKLTSLNIGVPTICVSMMAGMSDAMMKTALKWAASVPDVVISVGKISRFMNDIGAFEVYIYNISKLFFCMHVTCSFHTCKKLNFKHTEI